MKKIGIITFHMACNYGAVLQAFALQTKLGQLFPEDEVEIIDYYCPAIEDRTKIFHFTKTGNCFRDLLRFMFQFRARAVRYISFNSFRNKHLKLSKDRYNGENIKQIQNTYDIIWSGSDQIWNLESTGFDENYFLAFADQATSKCAYAASFGFQSAYENCKNLILNLLSRYDAISVREAIGTQELRDSFGCPPQIHVDPTLLLKADEWKNIEAKNLKLPDKYLLVYCILEPNQLLTEVRKISKDTGLPVYYIGNDIKNKDFKHLPHLSVEEFLTWISHADLVATTSFHGTVFSILNHVNFITEFNTQGKYNTRVEHLLDTLALPGRNVECTAFNPMEPINWNACEEKLLQERNRAENYLLNSDK